MSDTDFIPMTLKRPHEKAPDFVKLRGGIRRQEMIDYLSALDDEWVNFDIKVSKGGNFYAARDTWQPDSSNNGGSGPQGARSNEGFDPDVPF